MSDKCKVNMFQEFTPQIHLEGCMEYISGLMCSHKRLCAPTHRGLSVIGVEDCTWSGGRLTSPLRASIASSEVLHGLPEPVT